MDMADLTRTVELSPLLLVVTGLLLTSISAALEMPFLPTERGFTPPSTRRRLAYLRYTSMGYR